LVQLPGASRAIITEKLPTDRNTIPRLDRQNTPTFPGRESR
jgi:hypothetical protein